MKHINTYKTFESDEWDGIRKYIEREKVENIALYLNDIFQELTDQGFTCKVIPLTPSSIVITINGPKNSGFKYSRVEDYIESATDYMLSNEYKLKFLKQWDNVIEYEWVVLKGENPEIEYELKIIYEKK